MFLWDVGVCSSWISPGVPHGNTEPVLDQHCPVKILVRLGKQGTMCSDALEVSKENMGEVERMKTVVG